MNIVALHSSSTSTTITTLLPNLEYRGCGNIIVSIDIKDDKALCF